MASAFHKATVHGRCYVGGGAVTAFPPTSFLPSLQARKHLTHSAQTPQQLNQYYIPSKADSAASSFTRTFSNPTSSAPETALVCQSRISKLSTRSRKRMKIPARSSRVSRTTFTFVSNVCSASPREITRSAAPFVLQTLTHTPPSFVLSPHAHETHFTTNLHRLLISPNRAQWPQDPNHSPRTAQKIRPEEDPQGDQEEVCLQWHYRHRRRDGRGSSAPGRPAQGRPGLPHR
jgi:hypothetical protein